MSIVNPTGIGFLDFLYYWIILWAGPCTVSYLILFRAKRNRLINAYKDSGVEVLGMITHRKITIRRGAITGIEQSRSHAIRYAYKPPGSDIVHIKNFITVSKEKLQRRLMVVVVLPGQPESGVPKFLLSSAGCFKKSGPALWLCWVLSLAMVFYCVVVFALLIAFELQTDTHCKVVSHHYNQPNGYACVTTVDDYWESLVVVLVLGLLGSWSLHHADQKQIPGSVWSKERCNALVPVATATPVGPPSWQSYERMDERDEIPMAEAAAVLSSEEAADATLGAPSHAVATTNNASDADLELIATPSHPAKRNDGNLDNGESLTCIV